MSHGPRIRPFTQEDLDPVLALIEEAMGPGAAGINRKALFRWKHVENPFGPSIALVAEGDEGILGFRSLMRWRFAAPGGGGVIEAVRAVDTATAERARRSGVFTRLTAAGLEAARERHISFVFNTPNQRSAEGYLKLGWREVTKWPMWVRPRHAGKILRLPGLRGKPSGATVELPKDSPLVPATFAVGDGTLQEATKWARRTGAGLATPRDQAYLGWRYAQGPIRYDVYADPATPHALLIVRLRTRGSLREALVTEAFARHGGKGTRDLAALVRGLPEAAGADYALIMGDDPIRRSALLRAGCVRVPRAGVRFMVRPIGRRPEPDPLSPDAWSLTFGDLEGF